MKRPAAIAACCGGLVLAATVAEAAAPAAAGGPRLVRVGSFASPTHLAAPRGDRDRRFVVERAGRIVLLRAGRRSTFLDIRFQVRTAGEEGLLSMAFHPGYARNRRYLVYYVDREGAIVIRQFRATRRGNRTRPRSGRLVLRQPHPRTNHKGGQIAFGHDGMLYAAFGDGGGAGDPDRNAQDLSTLLGKLIRIDPRPRGGGYRIPRDNPFRGRAGARGEIFAYGLRNPYRFSFDRRSGDLTLADVGQGAVEEVNFLRARPRDGRPRAGANFGWPAFEGARRYRAADSAPGHVPPVHERTHAQGSCSIIGGFVVRDRRMGGLRGRYVYGDLCDPRLRAVQLHPDGARGDRALALRVPALVSLGEDGRGRVHAVSLAGGVFRLAPRR